MAIVLHVFIFIHLLEYQISYIRFIAITNSAKYELDAKEKNQMQQNMNS